MAHKTLPDWALAKSFRVDAARRAIRASAELRAMGTQAGPTRLYTEDEANAIRAAVAARQAKLSGAAEATANA
jgi:hypothetical protein